MAQVWIVERGMLQEGGQIVDVCASQQLAAEALADLIPSFQGERGFLVRQDSGGRIFVSTTWEWAAVTPYGVRDTTTETPVPAPVLAQETDALAALLCEFPSALGATE